ncbi:hypothetical protein E2C01_071009 [Portunus trituberculatus]|uniref:Uncharacterized protein n=1 Tax=Portunus trituberculatus TaxID=210409 RepID=A0A5B7HYV6_PORTR|nr:hypothetical protein [Portunus trituberculatus]
MCEQSARQRGARMEDASTFTSSFMFSFLWKVRHTILTKELSSFILTDFMTYHCVDLCASNHFTTCKCIFSYKE